MDNKGSDNKLPCPGPVTFAIAQMPISLIAAVLMSTHNLCFEKNGVE